MIHFKLSELAAFTGGSLVEGDTTIHGVSVDSRLLQPGELFIALPGEQLDGHAYVAAARESGAVAAMVSRPVDDALPQLLVPDPQLALGQIAAEWRNRHDLAVVGITGSNGKTTVKELVSSILAQQAPSLATMGNYNNELGLPLTLCRLTPEHRYAVLEMGAAKVGDIQYLARLARPHIGIVTNVGPAHLQGFGDERTVARTKGEMFTELPADGVAVINVDDPWADYWYQNNSAGRQIGFGLSERADVSARRDGEQWICTTPAGEFELNLALAGAHNRVNALAAASAALALDVPLSDIARGLARVQPVPGRLVRRTSSKGWTVIDDTYNANPASLYAGLSVLADESGESWLAFGDMKELGANSKKLHAEVGESARSLGVTRLFAIGEMSMHTVNAFGPGGEHFESKADLIKALVGQINPAVTCLVKGSRSMGMEQVVQALLDDDKQTGAD